MQTIETFKQPSSHHVLLDEIYAPSLPDNEIENQQHQKRMQAIEELHRFLESSCDCV